MANTVEMLRLMRHTADLLDACDPGVNGAEVARLAVGNYATVREALERATAETVAVGMATMVLRMVAAAIDDEPAALSGGTPEPTDG